MNEKQEKIYCEGSRAAWLLMLQTCLSNLGYDSPEANAQKYILEREATISKLRVLCRDYGDNDWDDNLFLPDIIDKHLERYLENN